MTMDTQLLGPYAIDLSVVASVEFIPCRGFTKAYVHADADSGGAISSAVLSAKKSLDGKAPSVAFSPAETITLDGTAVDEIDVSGTPYLVLECTTAESGKGVTAWVYLTDEGA